MKKKYIEPQLQCYKVRIPKMICTSPEGEGELEEGGGGGGKPAESKFIRITSSKSNIDYVDETSLW